MKARRAAKERRGRLRSLTREYRRWQRARARLVKEWAALLARLDLLAQARLQPWPPDLRIWIWN